MDDKEYSEDVEAEIEAEMNAEDEFWEDPEYEDDYYWGYEDDWGEDFDADIGDEDEFDGEE